MKPLLYITSLSAEVVCSCSISLPCEFLDRQPWFCKAKFGAAVNNTGPITAVKQIRGRVTGRREDKEEPEDSRRRGSGRERLKKSECTECVKLIGLFSLSVILDGKSKSPWF